MYKNSQLNSQNSNFKTQAIASLQNSINDAVEWEAYMSIEKIVEQALQDGYLTPSMEAEVGRICNTASELSIEEYMALDRLMGALLTG